MGPEAGIEPAARDPQSPRLPLPHSGHRVSVVGVRHCFYLLAFFMVHRVIGASGKNTSHIDFHIFTGLSIFGTIDPQYNYNFIVALFRRVLFIGSMRCHRIYRFRPRVTK